MSVFIRFAATAGLVLVLLSACQRVDDDGLAAAKAALARHDNAAALIDLKRALQRKPQLAEARFLLGTLLLERGEAAAAAAELVRARAGGVADAQVLPPLARALLAQSTPAQVLLLATDSAAIGDPHQAADVQTSLAHAHFALQDDASGQAALEAALRHAPKAAAARVLQARRLAAAGRLAEAAAEADATRHDHPGDAGVLLLRADLLAAQGQAPAAAVAEAYAAARAQGADALRTHQGALTALIAGRDTDAAHRALQSMEAALPNHPQTRYFAAVLALHGNDVTAARIQSDALLGGAPSQPMAQRLAGVVALQGGDLPQAARQLAAALRASPGDAALRRLAALAALRSGDPALALQTLAPLRAGPPEAETLTLAAVAHLQRDEADQAQALFTEAAALRPADTRLRTAVALGRLAAGDAATALGDLQQVAGLDTTGAADAALVSALIQHRAYAAALETIDVLRRKQPADPAAAMLRGEVHLRQGAWAAARTAFDQAQALAPTAFAPRGALAELDLRDKQPAQARQRFEALLALDPASSAALVALATLAEMDVQPGAEAGAEASRLLAQAVRVAPGQPGTRLLLIHHELRHRHAPAALSAAEAAVAALPDDPRLQHALARAAVAAGELPRALRVYAKLAAAQPGSAEPLRLSARVHMALRDPAAARVALQAALKAQPGSVPALQDLAHLEMGTGHPDAALALARRLQQLRPTDAAGDVLEAEAAASRRAWDDADAAYGRALRKPGAPGAIVKAQHAMWVAAGRRDRAERVASRWLQAQPGDLAFVQYLGDEAVLRRDFAAGEAHYLTVLRGQPDNAAVLNNLAWLGLRAGRPDALAQAERACSLRPDQAAYLDTLAQLLARAGQGARAMAVQQRALALSPDDGLLRLTLARLYGQSGDKARARSELDRLAALGPRFPAQDQVAALRQSL